MKVSVFGLGYVGLVTALSYAEQGHRVWGVDTDRMRISRLRDGISPIKEPGLDHLLRKALRDSALTLTTDAKVATSATELAVICVGTPSTINHGTDLSFVLKVADEIGHAIQHDRKQYIILLRSTVPPNTTRNHLIPALQVASRRTVGESIHVYFNPEFLRQGSAIEDFRNPPFTVVGTSDGTSPPSMAAVCELSRNIDAPLVVLNFQEAELLKFACNAFHALKIDFANEIGSLARRLGADPTRVMSAFVLDNKLNVSPAYLRPGFAFGGSCLPKDVLSLNHIAKELGLALPIHRMILPSNDAHLQRIVADLEKLDAVTIGIVGIAFKPNTDDLRESPALRLAQQLIIKKKDVLLHEPEIRVERLSRSNSKYLADLLPDYSRRLLDWPTLRRRADLVLITRDGIVPKAELCALTIPILKLSDLPIASHTANA